MPWEQIYQLLGIQDFIYFITSPTLQDLVFPVKLVFILFTAFFFLMLVWFYVNSSYIQAHFGQDLVEFFSRQAYGSREVNKRWQKIMKNTDSGDENDLKLAIIEADDFLYQILEDAGFEGDTFEQLLENASRKVRANLGNIPEAHQVRNAIVYDTNYQIEASAAFKVLSEYETVIKSIAIS